MPKGKRRSQKAYDYDSDSEDEEIDNLELEFFDFDPKVPHLYPTIVSVGARGSGKSTTSACIAEKFNETITRWYAWCGTKDTEDDYHDMFESHACVYGPDDMGIAALAQEMTDQNRRVRFYKKQKIPFPKEKRVGLIFDDCTSKRKFRRCELLEELFSNGRHYKAAIIITCQHLEHLPPSVREQADYLFMMNNNKKQAYHLHKEYVDVPDKFEHFRKMLNGVTLASGPNGEKLYQSLVYNNNAPGWKITDRFKVMRVPSDFDPSKVRLGDPAWREYNKTHYIDREWEIQEKEERRLSKAARLQALQERRQNQMGGIYEVDQYDDEDLSDSEDEKTPCIRMGRGKESFNVRIPGQKAYEQFIAQKQQNHYNTQNHPYYQQQGNPLLPSALADGNFMPDSNPSPYYQQSNFTSPDHYMPMQQYQQQTMYTPKPFEYNQPQEQYPYRPQRQTLF